MYHIFAGENCYPEGGVKDLKLSSSTLEGAIDFVLTSHFKENALYEADWIQIVREEDMKVVGLLNGGYSSNFFNDNKLISLYLTRDCVIFERRNYKENKVVIKETPEFHTQWDESRKWCDDNPEKW